MKVFLAILAFFLVLLLGLLIGAQNEQLVEVNYLLAKSELRLSVLMAILVLSGALLGIMAFSVIWLKLRWKIAQLQRKQKLTQSETP